MKVYIAEKPDIGRTLATYLWKNDYKKETGYLQKDDIYITWAYGHILGLVNPEEYDENFKSWSSYPIIPQSFKLKPSATTVKQLKVIKDLLSKADIAVHAGDPDREGQMLIDEILEYANFKGKVERLLINAKDDTSLKRAFEHIEDNAKYKNLYLAGMGRSQADWLVGMNLSRIYTVNARNYGYTNTFRIGRVKIPTLALVVNREKEINNFKPTKYFELQGQFIKDDVQFKAMFKPTDRLSLDNENRIKDEDVLKAIKLKISKAAIVVKDVNTKKRITYPPLPYSLDTLQIEANKKYGFSPKTVLDTVQNLYENKFVSYPRSDCNYIPEAQKPDAEKILAMLSDLNIKFVKNADISITSKAFDDKKITAHHAIIPTMQKPEALTEDEQKIYDMIAFRYILQFYKPCEFEKTEFKLAVADEIFAGSGKIVKEPGFTSCLKEYDLENPNSQLPKLTIGDKIAKGEYFIQDKITTPPKRFTEGTLLAAMANIYKFVSSDNPNRDKLKEVKGIGTPATRDTIISELQEAVIKGRAIDPCIKKVKKELVPTDFGTQLIETIDQSLVKPDTTAEMEYSLTEIANGKKDLASFIDDVVAMIYKHIKYAENKEFPPPKGQTQEICPICHSFLVRRFSQKANKHFYVCSKQCKINDKTIFYEDDNGKPLIIKCISCGGILARYIGKNGAFWSCTICKQTYDDKDNKPVLINKEKVQIYEPALCSICKIGKIIRRFSAKANKYYHICNNKDCSLDGKKIFYEDDKGKPIIAYCPKCKGLLSRIISKRGPCWICNSCKSFYPDDKGKPSLKKRGAKK